MTAALKEGRPVVALESTIITHGLSREPTQLSGHFLARHPQWDVELPLNLAAALAAENAVRATGATPATIALIDGAVRVGLKREELTRLAAQVDARKLSLRDLGSAVALSLTGGTTVAATTSIAARVGIRYFATGGIGGVHRGWMRTMDISADLLAIANHPVLVVCAGAKVLLDLPATLEALETLGIPTIGFRTRFLPRFTVEPDETLPLSDSVSDWVHAARIVRAHWSVRPTCGALLMQSCPEEYCIGSRHIESQLSAALADAEALGIRGAATTPFLLARLASATDGMRTTEANLALLLANATLAARVACAGQDASGSSTIA